MTKRLNYGPRFGSSSETTRGAGLGYIIPPNTKIGRYSFSKREGPIPVEVRRKTVQQISATCRKRKGLGIPSMPTFSFEEAEVIAPKSKDWRGQALHLARKLCKGEVIGLERVDASRVSVTLKRGKREIDACIDLVSEKVLSEVSYG
jgi:flagella basal body P-ring formation protein FlgA